MRVGLSYLPEQIMPAIRRGEIDLYLLAAAKQFNGDNWDLQGFRIVHVGDDDAILENGGLAELITPKQFYHPSAK